MKFTAKFMVKDNGFYLNEYDESRIYEYEKLEFNELEAALKWMVEKFETVTKEYPIKYIDQTEVDPNLADISYWSGKETVSISLTNKPSGDGLLVVTDKTDSYTKDLVFRYMNMIKEVMEKYKCEIK